MRYKLDQDGYFCAVFFGCNGVDCQEYDGVIPSGFLDNIKAYKLIDGVIVYDEERAQECANQCASQCNDYHLTSKKEVLELLNAELNYKKISISFSNNIGTAEIGSTVTSVRLSWSFNKTPVSVKLDGVAKEITSTGETISGLSLTSSKSWRLEATDEKSYTASGTTSISFFNGVYYGVAGEQATYDSAFVLGLTKILRNSKLSSFSVTAGANEYIYYCLPTRMGECSFMIGGFSGGIQLVDTISFTNASGYTENYYIYRSDYPNLGLTEVVVN